MFRARIVSNDLNREKVEQSRPIGGQITRGVDLMERTSQKKSVGVRLAASGAAVALLAVGGSVVGATSAQAQSKPGGIYTKLSAPDKVKSGETFKFKCKVAQGAGWEGIPVKVKEKGVSLHAKRYVGSNGNCTMEVRLFEKGKHKIKMVVMADPPYGNGGNQPSSWLKIKVK